eukprot:Protomagalhaensia_wolfi_Nauph_80__1427@NODE_1857_length_1304_cov_25_160474_g1450_i0_p1_GENE_NODE_1857_length_1304_cov_25_160474_g1450_i0NODE_1857_length_1304_cov_25_160474_g1450_i0_p1_ORF_typecomplete_len310_score13_38_NODE_1857_length_1304_cov_25_160474_g1450_i066995
MVDQWPIINKAKNKARLILDSLTSVPCYDKKRVVWKQEGQLHRRLPLSLLLSPKRNCWCLHLMILGNIAQGSSMGPGCYEQMEACQVFIRRTARSSDQCIPGRVVSVLVNDDRQPGRWPAMPANWYKDQYQGDRFLRHAILDLSKLVHWGTAKPVTSLYVVNTQSLSTDDIYKAYLRVTLDLVVRYGGGCGRRFILLVLQSPIGMCFENIEVGWRMAPEPAVIRRLYSNCFSLAAASARAEMAWVLACFLKEGIFNVVDLSGGGGGGGPSGFQMVVSKKRKRSGDTTSQTSCPYKKAQAISNRLVRAIL